jgi:hypothetical protein
MNYKLTRGGVYRLVDMAFIPQDVDNGSWRDYQDWLVQGNTPIPDDPPAPLSKDELDAVAARQYAKLNAIKSMSPSEIISWIDTNISNLADAKEALKTMAVAVSVLARRI